MFSMHTINYAEAAKALAESRATGEPTTGAYYVTAADPYQVDADTVTYMVGYASADPEECDDEGTPTAFTRAADGTVQCMGPSF